jgi:hypothetical protein
LELRDEFKRGATEIAMKRSYDMKNQRELSREPIKRLRAISRDIRSTRAPRIFGYDENPSAGYIASFLLGGDEGHDWATGKLKSHSEATWKTTLGDISMAKKLSKGDKVEWETSQGKTEGKVVKKQTTSIRIEGYKVKASKSDPQYIVESAKTGKRAAHKPGALHKA